MRRVELSIRELSIHLLSIGALSIGAAIATIAGGVTLSSDAAAQTAGPAPRDPLADPLSPPPSGPNERQVYLVRQDQSDCSNSNVPASDSPNVGGNLWLRRGDDGNTTVKVAMTVSPNTTYHFFLKCVRQLGDIKTGDEGTGFASFSFPTSSVGQVYAFDMYPEGAPPGNKFQSATVKFP
ncbi:MAG TPA: hypothetical protein VGC77_06235 [Rhodopseudomonas sp.]|uniref:hypothetical protein n=1 Tax=Rhodopseudomonas sp. TaxID=1078 RepID=UPI002ED8B47C